MERWTRQRVQTVGGLASYDVVVSKASVANAKGGQGDLLMTVPVAGRLPQTNGRSQLTQFIIIIILAAASALSLPYRELPFPPRPLLSSLGGQKRKDKKTRKSRSEEKEVGFSSASLFPTRKRKAVT